MQLINCSKFEAHAKMKHRRAPYDNIWVLDASGHPTVTLKSLTPDDPAETAAAQARRRDSSAGGGSSASGGVTMWPRRAVAPTLRQQLAAADDTTLEDAVVPGLPDSDDESAAGANPFSSSQNLPDIFAFFY